MAEMSLVSSRKFKLEAASKKGNSAATLALELQQNPTKLLSTVQIGITLIGILLGVYSGENLTNNLEIFLGQFSWIATYAHQCAVGIIVLFITFLSIVYGELLPKRIGMTYPEPIAMTLAKPMKFISIITSPFVALLSMTNDLVLKIFGLKKSSDSIISEEEIKSLIKEGNEGGEIQDIEHDIVARVFELGDRKVNTLFTHRSELVYFDINESKESIKEKIKMERHSAYPVCDDNDIDNLIGIVLLKDLFATIHEDDFKLKDYIQSPIFINKNTFAYKVLEIFRQKRMHYGIVVDEYGSTNGMVTMDDVVDALIGDVTEHDQVEYEIKKRSDNSWLVDGQYSIIEFSKYFDLDIDIDNSDYTTLAGFIISHSDQLPNIGDKISVHDYDLEIMDKDGQRIDKVMITKVR